MEGEVTAEGDGGGQGVAVGLRDGAHAGVDAEVDFVAVHINNIVDDVAAVVNDVVVRGGVSGGVDVVPVDLGSAAVEAVGLVGGHGVARRVEVARGFCCRIALAVPPVVVGERHEVAALRRGVVVDVELAVVVPVDVGVVVHPVVVFIFPVIPIPLSDPARPVVGDVDAVTGLDADGELLGEVGIDLRAARGRRCGTLHAVGFERDGVQVAVGARHGLVVGEVEGVVAARDARGGAVVDRDVVDVGHEVLTVARVDAGVGRDDEAHDAGVLVARNGEDGVGPGAGRDFHGAEGDELLGVGVLVGKGGALSKSHEAHLAALGRVDEGVDVPRGRREDDRFVEVDARAVEHAAVAGALESHDLVRGVDVVLVGVVDDAGVIGEPGVAHRRGDPRVVGRHAGVVLRLEVALRRLGVRAESRGQRGHGYDGFMQCHFGFRLSGWTG